MAEADKSVGRKIDLLTPFARHWRVYAGPGCCHAAPGSPGRCNWLIGSWRRLVSRRLKGSSCEQRQRWSAHYRVEPAAENGAQQVPSIPLGSPSPKRELVMVSNHTVLSSTVFQSGEDEVSGLASRRMASPQLASV